MTVNGFIGLNKKGWANNKVLAGRRCIISEYRGAVDLHHSACEQRGGEALSEETSHNDSVGGRHSHGHKPTRVLEKTTGDTRQPARITTNTHTVSVYVC